MSRPPLKKKLGQHHLRSGSLCAPLLGFLSPEGRRVLEVGPGGGVLTAELLAAGASSVWAVELDREWLFELRRRIVDPRLGLALSDVQDVRMDSLPHGTLVTGNLPYGVATRVVTQVLEGSPRVTRAAFLLQREVAERLVAQPGTRAYGSMTVLVELAARARLLGRVKPGSFVPPPRVESAFVGLELRTPALPVEERRGFAELVRLAFSQRRKTMRNSLGSRWPRNQVDEVLAVAGVEPGSRAEELSLVDFLKLHASRRRLIEGSDRIQRDNG